MKITWFVVPHCSTANVTAGDESKPIQQHVAPEAPVGPRSEPSDPFDGIYLQGDWSAAPSNGCTGNGWEGRYILTSGKSVNTEILHIEVDRSSTTFKFWDTLAEAVLWQRTVIFGVCFFFQRLTVVNHYCDSCKTSTTKDQIDKLNHHLDKLVSS